MENERYAERAASPLGMADVGPMSAGVRPSRAGKGTSMPPQAAEGDHGKPKAWATWESIVSSSLAVATFVFGIYTWWDSKRNPRPDEGKPAEKIVVVSPTPVAGVVAGAVPTGVSKGGALPEAVADPAMSPHVLTLSNGGVLSYYRNLGLDETHPGVERAVIVVAGESVSHDGHLFQGLMEQARRAGHDRDTLVVVPVFRTSEKPPRPDELRWSAGWEVGGTSATPGPEAISSFRVVDELIGEITDARRFPDLRTVVVAGNHTGGSFVNRYVAAGYPIIAASARGPIAIEHIIMGASSYLYLDRNRPVAGTERFEPPDAKACPDFNHYRYGLEKRNPAMARISTKILRSNMFRRKAVYVVGAQDVDTDHLDASCAAQLQGRNRYERAANYWNYIRRFPEWQAHAEFRPIPGAGHFVLSATDLKDVRDLLFGVPR